MPIIVSLLRGINVGGNKKIKMADLRDLYQSLGFKNTQTLLQSGNAVFWTDLTDMDQIGQMIADGIQDQFGFEVKIVLRTADEMQAIVDKHPFTDEQISDPAKISFIYLDGIPTEEAVHTLRDHNPGREEISADGYELFVFYPDGKGRSKLDSNRIERTLKVSATERNWNTTHKILQIIDTFAGDDLPL